jgi:hypothetical protein
VVLEYDDATTVITRLAPAVLPPIGRAEPVTGRAEVAPARAGGAGAAAGGEAWGGEVRADAGPVVGPTAGAALALADGRAADLAGVGSVAVGEVGNGTSVRKAGTVVSTVGAVEVAGAPASRSPARPIPTITTAHPATASDDATPPSSRPVRM